MVSEAELVRRAKRGDAVAFERLVAAHAPRLYGLAARMLGSPEDARDAVQEALLRAWLGLPRFRGEAQLSTWLYRIALNAIRDQHARARPAVALEDVAEPADPHDRAALAELSGGLQRALLSLDEDYRAAVVLYDLLGTSYAEAAELLGVPEGTVKSRIYRGRRALAQALGTAGLSGESDSA